MIKTQIQLEQWQYEAIRRQSAVTSRSMSDLIREALTTALERKVPRPALSDIAGKFNPVTTADLKTHDAAWADSIR